MTIGVPSDELGDSTAPLVVRTVSLDVEDLGALVDLLPADHPVAWVRRGEGLVGWGAAARLTTAGATRFADADKWWRETTARAVVRDEVEEPGTGLVCFGTFGFADEPGDSALVVPAYVVGRRGDRAWLTTISATGLDRLDPSLDQVEPLRPPAGVRFVDGALNGDQWMTVVADAVTRIGEGDLEKVVLARDLVATADEPIDVRWPLRRLTETYPMCWTFHVDGLFGATPEMLVRRERGLVTSRVLAGTIRRTGDDQHDLALAAALARSSKDLEEHEYAVRSVADALEPHCSSMNVPEAPFVLHLPNVMHLATDVAGVVHDAATVSSLHHHAQRADDQHQLAGRTAVDDRRDAVVDAALHQQRNRQPGNVFHDHDQRKHRDRHAVRAQQRAEQRAGLTATRHALVDRQVVVGARP